MPNPAESANLLLKLYELRREDKMRAARDFMFGFNPTTADEYLQAMLGPNSAYIRMVTSYWEMAASFVTNGAIDSKMFDDANGEHLGVFAKIEPVLNGLREKMQSPDMFKNLEQICMGVPGGPERVRAMQARMKQIAGMLASQRAQSA